MLKRQTTPLTKFIRTGEGVLVYAFNLTLLIVPIVSDALTPQEAVKWAAILNSIVVLSRTGLKMVAAAQGLGAPGVQVPAWPAADATAVPAEADLAPASAEPSWHGAVQVAADLSNVGEVVSDAEELATGPGANAAPALRREHAPAAPRALAEGGDAVPADGEGDAQPAPFLVRLGA